MCVARTMKYWSLLYVLNMNNVIHTNTQCYHEVIHWTDWSLTQVYRVLLILMLKEEVPDVGGPGVAV